MPMTDPGNLLFTPMSLLIGKRVTIDDSGSVAVHTISSINSRKARSGEVLTVSLSDEAGVCTVRDIALSRLTEVPPKPATKPATEDSPYKGIGTISATQDEATEWFVFLMLQAGALFQAMPTDARDEVVRLMEARDCPDLDRVPTLAYYDAAFELYSRLEGDE